MSDLLQMENTVFPSNLGHMPFVDFPVLQGIILSCPQLRPTKSKVRLWGLQVSHHIISTFTDWKMKAVHPLSSKQESYKQMLSLAPAARGHCDEGL